MPLPSLDDVLRSRPYPGRGCVAARLVDGRLALAYFLTGRSTASRSRELLVDPSGAIVVRDTSGGPHDDLRHYVAGVRRDGWTVVGNGDQVEPIASALAAGSPPATAWLAHTYEPDPPIFTPRIAIAVSERVGVFVGSAVRSSRGGGSTDRLLVMPETLPPGEGVLVTTYDGTTDVVTPSGVALSLRTPCASYDELADLVWGALDPVLAVACFAAPADDLSAAVVRAS